jgi:hypothetical protein
LIYNKKFAKNIKHLLQKQALQYKTLGASAFEALTNIGFLLFVPTCLPAGRSFVFAIWRTQKDIRYNQG